MTILKGVDVEKIKKIFNVSSSAIKTENNKNTTYKVKFKEVHLCQAMCHITENQMKKVN